MILVTQYGPDGQPWTWVDTDTRTVHDVVAGQRPFTAAESALADQLVESQGRVTAADELRSQLAGGVADITAARDAAAADAPVAFGLRDTAATARTQAQAQRATVAAWNPSVTYSAADLAAIRTQMVTMLDRQAAVCDALAGLFEHRGAVDLNAVMTDNALLWLARLASGLLEN